MMRLSRVFVAISVALSSLTLNAHAANATSPNFSYQDHKTINVNDDYTGLRDVFKPTSAVQYRGEGNREGTLEIINNKEKTNTLFYVDGNNGGSVEISNLDSLTMLSPITMSKDSTDKLNDNNAILARYNGTVKIHDINKVNFGTNESFMNVDQVLNNYGEGATITFENIRELNMYSRGLVIQVQSDVEFKNVENIHIENQQNRYAVQVYGEGTKKTHTLTVTGAKKFEIVSANGGGVSLTDKAGDWTGKSSVGFEVEADEISIDVGTGDAIKVYRDQENSGKTTANLTAGKSIYLSSNGFALNLDNKTGDETSIHLAAPAVSLIGGVQATKGNTTIDGDNVLISAENALTLDADSSITFNKKSESQTTANLTIEGNVNSSGTVTLNDQTVKQTNGTFKVTKLETNDNATLVFTTTETGGVNIDQLSGKLDLQADGSIADKLGSAEAAATHINEKVLVLGSGVKENTSLSGKAGDMVGAWDYDPNTGKTTYTSGESLSPTLAAVKHFNAATMSQWRYENNHLTDRLGDVRNHKDGIGSWARVYGADAKVSDSVSTNVKFNTIQVGTDVKVGDSWIVGAAFGYTDADAEFDNGSASSDGYTLAAYGTAFFPCGGYVDVIGRIGRLSADVDVMTNSAYKASYDNTALGLSVEFGYRLDVSKTFYLTPQAELSYGYVKGDDFVASNGIKISQDDFESLVGRLGVEAGANFAEGDGRIYLTASLNHDFMGDTESVASRADNPSQHLSEDLGGTWVSYGVGAQFNVSDRWYFYGSLTRANGSDYQENYRYSVGTRFVW